MENQEEVVQDIENDGKSNSKYKITMYLTNNYFRILPTISLE